MSRELKDFKKALLDISQDYKMCLCSMIVALEDTYLNTKPERLAFAKMLRENKLDYMGNFISEEKRLQKEEKTKNYRTRQIKA